MWNLGAQRTPNAVHESSAPIQSNSCIYEFVIRGCASCCKPCGQSQQQAQFINVKADNVAVISHCSMQHHLDVLHPANTATWLLVPEGVVYRAVSPISSPSIRLSQLLWKHIWQLTESLVQSSIATMNTLKHESSQTSDTAVAPGVVHRAVSPGKSSKPSSCNACDL